jgi:hypothetical protein
MAAVVRKPAAPLVRPCARCGEPFSVAPFNRFRLCPACRAASDLESSAATREARRRRKAEAARKAPARSGNGSLSRPGRRWRSRIPPEEALAALQRACGPDVRAVTAAEYAAALGVGRSAALGILEGLRALGLASARGRDPEEKPMGRLGAPRWVPRPKGAGA